MKHTDKNPDAAPGSARAPLNLDQFTGFTPAPWLHQPLAGGHQYAVYSELDGPTVAVIYTKLADAVLLAAAPSLLEECRRQREEIAKWHANAMSAHDGFMRLKAALEALTQAAADSDGSGLPVHLDHIEAARAALQQTGEADA